VASYRVWSTEQHLLNDDHRAGCYLTRSFHNEQHIVAQALNPSSGKRGLGESVIRTSTSGFRRIFTHAAEKLAQSLEPVERGIPATRQIQPIPVHSELERTDSIVADQIVEQRQLVVFG